MRGVSYEALSTEEFLKMLWENSKRLFLQYDHFSSPRGMLLIGCAIHVWYLCSAAQAKACIVLVINGVKKVDVCKHGVKQNCTMFLGKTLQTERTALGGQGAEGGGTA